jgi:NAD(P)-dependent dehydrogenase (short-subunit alcohol dehydrogenase family)
MRGLAGRVAIVTGASSGIGLATASALLDGGARVVLVARRAERLRAAVEGLRADTALAHVADVADAGAAEASVRAAVERFGRVDLLCNNAGVDGQARDVADLDGARWHELMEVNVGGALRLTQAFARHVRGRGATGAIVNVASINGLTAERHFADYNTSKGALIALTRSTAIDLAPDIRANAVCPGYVETEMTAGYLADPDVRARVGHDIPLGRVGQPREIADTIAFLLSDRASYITGAIITADGGRTAGWRGAI